MECPPLLPNRSQQTSQGNPRSVQGRVTRLLSASLRHKDISSGLPFWSSVAVTGKPDAVKGCAA
jgi:hypothetical protein